VANQSLEDRDGIRGESRGRAARVMRRLATAAGLAEPEISEEDVASVMRSLLESPGAGQALEIVGSAPGLGKEPPRETHPAAEIDAVSFALPGSPMGLVLHMDEHGDGRLQAVGQKVQADLGADGMWWVVTRLIEALEHPDVVSEWPRFLTLGTRLGGPATQASLQTGERAIAIVWRRLNSGVVGDVVAVQELTPERASGWLTMLRPVRDTLERHRAHRQRLRPAKMAEKWARVLERAEAE
jgi:hypothetical protein